MGRTKNAQDYKAALAHIAASGLSDSPAPSREQEKWDVLPSLSERVKTILGVVNKPERKPTNMLFFVMYDIESNKVRRYVVKYLEKKGCFRVQKSIFLADLPMENYQAIRADLAEVQAAYENMDSILIVPISTDYLRAMKVIGENIDIDIVTHNKNTLFF